jgi:outer membrane protein assembly factor BamB
MSADALPISPGVVDINDIVLLGAKCRVAAFSRADGHEYWSTDLSTGQGFVTVMCDGTHVFAHTAGHLYCLELMTGRLLWMNKLLGYGYGLGSLCLADGTSSDRAAIQLMVRAEQAGTAVVDGMP